MIVRPAASLIVTPVAAGVGAAGTAVGASVGAAVGAAVAGIAVGATVDAAVAGAVAGALVGACVVDGALVPQALRISASSSASADALRRIDIVAPLQHKKPDLQY